MKITYLKYIASNSTAKLKGIVQATIAIINNLELSKTQFEDCVNFLQEISEELEETIAYKELQDIIQILDLKIQKVLDENKLQSKCTDDKLVLTQEGSTKICILKIMLNICQEYLMQSQIERLTYIDKILKDSE